MANKRKFKVYDSDDNEIIICVPDVSGDDSSPVSIQYVGNAEDFASQYPSVFDSEYTVLTTDSEVSGLLSELGYNVYYMSPDSRLYFNSYNYLYVDDGKIVASVDLLLGVQPFITGLLPSICDIPSYWMRKIEQVPMKSVYGWKFTYEQVFTTQETFNRYVSFIESAEEIFPVVEIVVEKPKKGSEVVMTKSSGLRSGTPISITPNSDVQFKYGSRSAYTSATKDPNTFYFITDDPHEVYLGTELVSSGSALPYSTTLPSANNTSGFIKVIVTDSDPATKYDGYLYIITESNV